MSNTMNAKELLEMFKNMVDMSFRTTDNAIQREEYETLYYILEDGGFLLKCLMEDFPIQHAPSLVYLFDLERNMLWAKDRGYTRDIYNAGLYSLDRANKMVEEDLDNNTKIVYFEGE